jgi:hypothetical protein
MIFPLAIVLTWMKEVLKTMKKKNTKQEVPNTENF